MLHLLRVLLLQSFIVASGLAELIADLGNLSGFSGLNLFGLNGHLVVLALQLLVAALPLKERLGLLLEAFLEVLYLLLKPPLKLLDGTEVLPLLTL